MNPTADGEQEGKGRFPGTWFQRLDSQARKRNQYLSGTHRTRRTGFCKSCPQPCPCSASSQQTHSHGHSLHAVHVHTGPPRPHSHVFHRDVLQDLAVVHVPHRLVVPHLGGQQDGPQNNPLPVRRTDVNLCICEEPFQVHLEDTSTLAPFIPKPQAEAGSGLPPKPQQPPDGLYSQPVRPAVCERRPRQGSPREAERGHQLVCLCRSTGALCLLRQGSALTVC